MEKQKLSKKSKKGGAGYRTPSGFRYRKSIEAAKRKISLWRR